MFWLKRLKAEKQGSSWLLAYSDLVSLLLGVFVMIAAMSEIQTGTRFRMIRDGVQSAFGFDSGNESKNSVLAGSQPLTLRERLRQAGLRDSTGSNEQSGTNVLACCDVLVEDEQVIIRVAGSACFDEHSAQLKDAGRRALSRMAEFLSGGQARIVIRGHSGSHWLPAEVPFRDVVDLSYQRARAAADVLQQAGLQARRLTISALGDREPLVARPLRLSSAINDRIEIIVKAVPAAETQQTKDIAEMNGVDNG
jgi:flagellar motor protein MotB